VGVRRSNKGEEVRGVEEQRIDRQVECLEDLFDDPVLDVLLGCGVFFSREDLASTANCP
jgi:hypothetical protein